MRKPKRQVPTELDALLTEEEAAQLIGFSKRTLQAWRYAKIGPPFVLAGRSVRYRRGTLLDWVSENTQHPAIRQQLVS